jgi:uncharacterized protein (UPF0147 family)
MPNPQAPQAIQEVKGLLDQIVKSKDNPQQLQQLVDQAKQKLDQLQAAPAG